MQPIERGKETLFKKSTLEELRAYCKMEGIPFKMQHREPALTTMLCRHFDLTVEESSPISKVVRDIRPKNSVSPPMNLRSEGIWQGKRYRGVVHKPENEIVKNDAGFAVFANGSYGGTKEGYWIRFGAVQVIPAPIYARLRELEKHTKIEVDQEVVIDSVKTVDKSTGFEHSRKYNMEYEVEAGTEHLPSSMLEWHIMQGPRWYAQRDLRELGIICGNLGIETKEWNEKGTKMTVPKSREKLLAEVNTFVFGYPEIDISEDAEEVA